MNARITTILALTATLTGTVLASTATASAPLIPEVSEAPSVRKGLPDQAPNTPTITEPGVTTRPAVKGTAAVDRGVSWLLSAQHDDGGWGAGNWSLAEEQAPSDVATTSFVVLALLRDGGGAAKHKAAITKGVEHVVAAIDKAPTTGALITEVQNTQPQAKLGRYVDTHMAALMLGEVTGQLDAGLNARVAVAYDKVIGKVQAAENGQGSFEQDGWAPVLSDTIATMSLNEAKKKGLAVDDELLARADKRAAESIDAASGEVDSSRGAGVELYGVASTLRQSSAARSRAGSAPAADAAAEAAAGRVAQDTDALIQGFGSLGGEEMLSYMMISDALAEQGGEEWSTWQNKIAGFLQQTQNPDGSWVGHHCITSRTFTTAGAVMTLTAGKSQTGSKVGQLRRW